MLNIINGVWISFHDLGFLITNDTPKSSTKRSGGHLICYSWTVGSSYCDPLQILCLPLLRKKYLDTGENSSRTTDRMFFNSHHQMSLHRVDTQMIKFEQVFRMTTKCCQQGAPDLMSEWRGGGCPGAMSRGSGWPLMWPLTNQWNHS